jgi:hypothetical protein
MVAVECYKINHPNVVHEVIDEEAVIVDLSNGMYYSLDKAGADVWSLIDAGTDARQIASIIAAKYDGNLQDIEEDLNQLLDQLQQESLIVPDARQDSGSGINPGTVLQDPADRPPFEKPLLVKYTDMEDLLLLDPIHDVDDTGWPNTEADNG